MIWQIFRGLDLHSLYTDPAPHIITAHTGSTVNNLDDLDVLDDLDDLDGLGHEICSTYNAQLIGPDGVPPKPPRFVL